MYGAIIGDLAGSIYEYDQTKGIKEIKIEKLIEDNSFYSDDTILTIAIADAILNDKDYNKYLRSYIEKYNKKEYLPKIKPYFKYMFSPSLIKWSKQEQEGESHGNGAMMRISPVGYLFNTELEVITNAKLATVPSHNSEIAINSAQTIALIIYYFRQGLTKEEVFSKLNLPIEFKPFTSFNLTCEDTINNCLYALYYSTNFEDAIRKAIAMGGDTDTNAAIVGSMAESLYGIKEELKNEAEAHLPEEFINVLKKADYK